MRSRVDLTGQRFGKLVVIERLCRNQHGEIVWHCRCDCGNERDVVGSHLKNGIVTDCQICARQRRAIDLTGQRFGRLVAIERAPVNAKNGNALWVCQCDCGERRVVDGYILRSGKQRSCGCLRRETARRNAEANAAFMAVSHNNGAALKNSDGVYYSSLHLSKRNHTGHIGVSIDHKTHQYIARLKFHGEYVLNQSVKTYEEACALRENAELKYLHRNSARQTH